MGKCQSVLREIRFIIEETHIDCFVRVDVVGDCPLGVQGWHSERFVGADTNCAKILSGEHPNGLQNYLEWPLKAPPEGMP